LPIGFSASRRPARLSLIAADSASMALLDRRRQGDDRHVLPEDHGAQVPLQMPQRLLVVGGDGFGRDARDLRDDLLDIPQRDRLPPLVLRQKHPAGADLVDHVDRLVRQLAVVDVLRREIDRGADRLIGVANLVVLLVDGLEAPQDADGVFRTRLRHVDLLEAPDERAVLLEVVAELLVGRAADAAKRTSGQSRLEQVGGIHRPAARGASTDDGVDLVDEQHAAGMVLELGHHRLQPLLEIAAVAGAGEQRPHVEREDRRLGQNLGHVAFDDALGEALGDCSLADARITHIERVVLGAAAEDLDRPLDLALAPDQRVDLAGLRLLVQVDAVVRQRVLPAAAALLLLLRSLLGRRLLRSRRALARRLGDAVADEVHRVESRHVLQLEEVDGMALALAEQRHEDVGAGDLVPARGLHMDRRTLHDALEAGGRLRVARAVGRQTREVLVEEFGEVTAQLVEIDAAGAQHSRRIGVFRQPEKQMLERGVFVLPFTGE
jgi:hypothetical protein